MSNRNIKYQHCRPCPSPIEQKNRLTSEDGDFVEDVSQFRSMVGSLVYITITEPDIAYVVGVVSQFMQKPRTIHLDAVYRILRYLKGSPGKEDHKGENPSHESGKRRFDPGKH